jgi:hypothetical protein
MPVSGHGGFRLAALLLAASAGFLLSAMPARAVLLDWDTLTWTAGSLSQSYDIDATNPGNDVTITITGNTSRLGDSTPKLVTSVTGGLSPVEKSLQFYLDLSSRTEAITVTITFNYTTGVDSLNFKLFDIDKNLDPGNSVFQDQIRSIKGRMNTGPWVGAAVTGSASNTVANSGTTNATVTGTGLNAENAGTGNATVNFGTNIVNSISFVYGSSSSNSTTDPSIEWITLHDISYRKVPEVGSAAVIGGGCVLFLVLALFRARRKSLLV